MQWLVDLVNALPEAVAGIIVILEAVGLTRRRGSPALGAVRQALGRKR